MDYLAPALADSNPEVVEQAVRASWRAGDLLIVDLVQILDIALESPAAKVMCEGLFHDLGESAEQLPTRTIELLERALDSAGLEIADIRTAAARIAPDVAKVVVRLYRQSDGATRARCLDVIDRLLMVGAYRIERELEDER